MSDYYRGLDAPHFEYRMQAVAGIGEHAFRGPVPDLAAPYIACIGGAQTMGRFVERPYPTLLGEALGLPCLNLGLGGAGPGFACGSEVLPLLQRARLVVVQIFSGRSASNSWFDNSASGRNGGRIVRTGEYGHFEDLLDEVMSREDPALLRRIVAETREDYVFSMERLGASLQVPSVLLWLSRRAPDYEIDWRRPSGVLSHYPQLIDRETIDAFRPAFGDYVECGRETGLPQRLWCGDEVDGTRRDEHGVVWNDYYPSPEMHAAAFEALLPVCRQLLDADRRG